MAKFIKLKDQVVSVDSIVKVEAPIRTTGIEWRMRTLLDSGKTLEHLITSFYSTKEEAQKEYDRIVAQLCADKE